MTRRGKRRIALLLALAAVVALGFQLDRTQLWEGRAAYAGWQVRSHVLGGWCELADPEGAVRHRGSGAGCAAELARLKKDKGLKPVSGHLVVLLHGMGRSPRLFAEMAPALRAAGYETLALAYPSLTRDIEGHARHLTAVLDGLEGVERVSFVTHSLGGIVLREALAGEAAWRGRIELGRAVMLAPPNRGSVLAAALNDWSLYQAIGGPAAAQLADDRNFAKPPAGFEIGVIAGGRGDGEGYNPTLEGDDDGIVTVEETRLEGARDFLVVPAVHTFIAAAPETIAATLSFLDTGAFR